MSSVYCWVQFLWSFLQLSLLVAYVRCLPCMHVGKLLECLIPLGTNFLLHLWHMIASWLLLIWWVNLYLLSLWGLLSAHPLAFIVPSRIPLRNIRLSDFLLSSCDILFLLCGISACQVCSCLTSLSMALSPLLPNAVSLSLMLSCISIMCAWVFGNTILVFQYSFSCR